MAKVTGNSGAVKIGAAVVAEITKFDVTITPVIIQDVAIGDTWAAANAGSKSWSGSIECFFDITDTDGQNVLLPGNTVALLLYPEGQVVGKWQYSGNVIIGAVTVSTVVDTHITTSFAFTGKGSMTAAAYAV